MKYLMTLALALSLSACVPADEKETTENNQECTQGCEETSNAKGAFVSGHLGNYMDCPAEGFPNASEGAGARAEAADFAPCPEDQADSCGGPLNCEGAQMTVRITNTGAPLTGVTITKIELYSMDGVMLGELPMGSVQDATANASFGGSIDDGESADLRIDFTGPENLTQLIADVTSTDPEYTESAFVRVTVDLGNGETLTIESDELFVLPMVVT